MQKNRLRYQSSQFLLLVLDSTLYYILIHTGASLLRNPKVHHTAAYAFSGGELTSLLGHPKISSLLRKGTAQNSVQYLKNVVDAALAQVELPRGNVLRHDLRGEEGGRAAARRIPWHRQPLQSSLFSDTRKKKTSIKVNEQMPYLRFSYLRTSR